MKKILLYLSGALIIIYVLLNFIDFHSEYKSERALWIINKQFFNLAKDPKAIPDATFNTLIKDYESYGKKYSYSKLVPASEIFLGRVYAIKENYVKAREIYEETFKKNRSNADIAVQALVEIGQTYAAQKDEANLLNTYERILKDYPLTNLGIHIPILKAKLYSQNNHYKQAMQSLDEAIEYYKNLIAKHPNSQVEVISLRLLGISYMDKKEWEAGVKTFCDLLLKYPDTQNPKNIESIVKTINTISIMQLKNFNIPMDFYNKFITTHPNHPFNKQFTEILNKIIELKEKTTQSTNKKN